MSTDIHTFIEQYSESNKCWFLLKDDFSGDIKSNDHTLFENLLKIQKPGDSPKTKGFPNDISLGVKQYVRAAYYPILHNSYYSLNDFLDIYKHTMYTKEHIASLNLRHPNLSIIDHSVLHDYNAFNYRKARFAYELNTIKEVYTPNQYLYRVLFWFNKK